MTQWQTFAGGRPLMAMEGERANSLRQLTTLAKEQGKYEETQRLYQQSLDIFKQQADQSGQAGILHNLGEIALQRGEYKEARDLYWQCLDVYKRLGDESGRAGTLLQLGAIAQVQEEDEEAQRFYQQSLFCTASTAFWYSLNSSTSLSNACANQLRNSLKYSEASTC